MMTSNNQNGSTAYTLYNQSSTPTVPWNTGQIGEALGKSATTGTLTVSGNVSQQLSNTWLPYGYSYPVYYPAHNESRVVALEAEVKVLREMLAAVLSGRELPKAKAKR